MRKILFKSQEDWQKMLEKYPERVPINQWSKRHHITIMPSRVGPTEYPCISFMKSARYMTEPSEVYFGFCYLSDFK